MENGTAAMLAPKSPPGKVIDFDKKKRNGFYPEFTDTSKKPIVARRSVYVEAKEIQSGI